MGMPRSLHFGTIAVREGNEGANDRGDKLDVRIYAVGPGEDRGIEVRGIAVTNRIKQACNEADGIVDEACLYLGSFGMCGDCLEKFVSLRQSMRGALAQVILDRNRLQAEIDAMNVREATSLIESPHEDHEDRTIVLVVWLVMIILLVAIVGGFALYRRFGDGQ